MTAPALALYLAASALSEPLWRFSLQRRARRGKEDPSRLPERLGHAATPRPEGPLVWFHALGIGEAGAMLSVLRALREERPDVQVLLTTNTRTGADGLAKMGLPEGIIHQYAPIDAPAPIARFLHHWRPDAFVLAELDLWPRMLHSLSGRNIPMLMVNARLTDRRFAGRMRVRPLFSDLLGMFKTILVQDPQSATRMAQLGADSGQVRVAGLLKAAAAPLPDQSDARQALAVAIAGRPVWCAAATEAREHAALLAAHAVARETLPDLLMILAPRQLTDAQAASDLAKATFGAPPPRRSQDALPTPADSVFLADSMGEMGVWYRLAPVSFIGHSLDLVGDPPLTGKNPFEAALLGSVVLHGPCTGNFSESYAALDQSGAAIALTTTQDLPATLVRLLTHPQLLAQHAQRAEAVLDQARGALPLTLDALFALIGGNGSTAQT
ncbi:MAG: 3-deoxy-D-manno-octulosonic acid transferase [Rhodobacteraceae bacterium]|nr:3-deoxy-D-manno-octulosonic acid transferase [Paracoccaceae bacterium]MCF8515938.1 3-deoxy-D-manno-octulosonic acid transferase [Paracoccaceae bacterium]MCF8520293.1 3-deoxy-D-manno-octulosonic acid transferase [Paracoccaceae bacterium]